MANQGFITLRFSMHLEAAISKPDGWKNISLSQTLNTVALFSLCNASHLCQDASVPNSYSQARGVQRNIK